MEENARQYMTDLVIGKVKDELDRSEKIHGPFSSFHEGIAIIREEYRELEDAVFWGVQKTGSLDGIETESIQLAAMAVRLAMMVAHVPREAYQPKPGLTDLEQRLYHSLRFHVSRQEPRFCKVCCDKTKDSPQDCKSDCPFKQQWETALDLLDECEKKVSSSHVSG